MTDKERTFYTKRYLIPAERVKTATEVEVKFAVPGQMNGIYDLLRMMTSYSRDASLAGLTFDTGSLSGVFTAGQSGYTLTVDAGTPAVRMHAVPSHKNALVYVNGILIEDTLPRTVFLTNPVTNVHITVKAEDLAAVKEYTVTMIKPS
ncbi:Cadherin-like beta sandwich domain protein [compost metagenome]